MRLACWLRVPLLLRLVGISQRVGQQLPPREPARTPAAVSPPPLAEKRPEPALRLEVAVLESWKGPVVRLRGEAGVAEAQALQAAVLRLAAGRPACVTFDLSELVFISSLAMGVLVAYRRGVVRNGGRARLAEGLQPAVKEALARTGLLDLFEGATDTRQAPNRPAGPTPRRSTPFVTV